MSDNISFLLNSVLDTSFQQRPVPELSPDEVLVEVKKTGICGSDVHFYAEGRIADNIVTQPFVLGHESSGVIAKLGSGVTNVKVGDRVAMEPGATCRICDVCKTGRYQLCGDCHFAADHPRDGTLGRYYKLPADLTYKLPDHLTLEDGAMMEPLSVAVHAVSYLAKLRTGQNVAVFGSGPIGLLCMAVAKAFGAARIIAIDINPVRLEFARAYAATDTFLSPNKEQGETNIAFSKRAADLLKNSLGVKERGPDGLDLVIDATGAEACIQMALFVAKVGGTYIQVGLGPNEVEIPVTLLLVKELTVKGSFRYGPGDYPLALALASSGKVDLKPLITHRYKFEDAASAFNTTRLGKSADGKAVIKAIISGPDVDPSAV
ncbi:hypothetical protein M0805_000637 [Coniferiporia weirii]|nr:hypothetical protein M0805_000637 [Coniferiporia weirii]